MFPRGDMLGFYSSISLHYFSLTAGTNCRLQRWCKMGLRVDSSVLGFFFFFVPNVFTDFSSPQLNGIAFKRQRLNLLFCIEHFSNCCLLSSHGHPTTSTFKWDSPPFAPRLYKQTGSHWSIMLQSLSHACLEWKPAYRWSKDNHVFLRQA